MRIPSYDDLTPSIPDVAPGEAWTSLRQLLPDDGAARSTAPRLPWASEAAGPGETLFAALHGAPASGDRLAGIAREFSPRIERHAGGTVVLDAAGLQRLFGDCPTLADHLVRAGAARVAISTSQIAAVLLSRWHEGVTVATGRAAEALRPVPLAILQEVVVDAWPAHRGTARDRRTHSADCERTFDVLRRWGIVTAGEFAELPAAELSARLGPQGLAMQRLARGLDPRPLIPDPGVTRFLGSLELEWPLDTLEPLSFVFARLIEPLALALERADRGAIALHLRLRLTDRTTHARTIPLPAAMRDPRILRTLLLLDLESHPPPAAIDVVSVELDPAPARIVQYSLLERAVPSPETLATLMARLTALVGESRCGAPMLDDSHRPDGFSLGDFAVKSQLRRVRAERFGGASPELVARPSGEERRRATPNSQTVDDCCDLPAVLKRFRPPVAVRVAVEHGRPVRVAIDRRGMPGGTVRQAAGPWRTSGGWWQPERWNRDEWEVALSDGSVCRLFHDRERGGWFLDGVFD